MAQAFPPQLPPPQRPGLPPDDRLPDGRSRSRAILKHDHEKTLEMVSELAELARSLEEELEENKEHVLSLGAIEKAEQIEKLAKDVQKRLKRFR